MRRLATLMFTFLFVACAHKAQKPAPPPSERVFPYGIYQHKVMIQIREPSRSFDMKGVVKFSETQLNVVGLSQFGTTVFRITENFKTGEIKKEFFLDAIKQNAGRFEYFYFLIRELLLTPKGVSEFERRGAKFKLSRPDAHGIFRLAHIEHPQFDLDIEVTGYEY